MAVLALAEGALRAVLDPGRPSEANHVHLVQAGFGDVIADRVSLTRIGDTAWAALVLRKDTKFTLYLWASQGPAVNFSLQAAALTAILDPGVTAVVHGFPVLMQALAAQPWVALRAAGEVNCGVFAVTDHPSTHNKSSLAGTHRAPVVLQHPDLAVVFDFPVVHAVPCAVLSMGTPAIVATVQVEANGVIGTAVPPSPTFINIFTGFSTWRKHPIVMVAISALTVVPPRQVNAVGTAVTLNKALRALINVCLTAGSGEALWASTDIGSNAGTSVSAAVFAESFARGSIPSVARLADAVVTSNGVKAQSVLVTVVLVCEALVMFRTRVIVDSDVPCLADTQERARCVHTHGVLTAVMAPLCTLVNVFTVGIVLPEGPETIPAAAHCPVVQVPAD